MVNVIQARAVDLKHFVDTHAKYSKDKRLRKLVQAVYEIAHHPAHDVDDFPHEQQEQDNGPTSNTD
jgi:hypothetical protein